MSTFAGTALPPGSRRNPDRELLEKWIATYRELRDDGANINDGLRARWGISRSILRVWCAKHGVDLEVDPRSAKAVETKRRAK